jgi:RimJ/RimL family protein N-acetyltransferase
MAMASEIIRRETGLKVMSLEPNIPADTITKSRLSLERFDEAYLERSYHWLRDPEIKRLTMARDFTAEEQLRWFARLPEKTDYLIWGLSCDGIPIGAMGLKHITRGEAEYWGYIGDRSYWHAGLGGEMMRYIFSRAKKMGLNELYLKVHRDNARALRLYTRVGFITISEDKEVFHMRFSLGAARGDGLAAWFVKRYTPDHQREWDTFLKAAKNATFLFRRDYMDYHCDRFADHSLMIFCGEKLAALLPANRATDGSLISHEGLTYGGLVVSRAATLHEVLGCFHAGLRYLHEQQISSLRYKRMPGFYNTLADDEVAYALFLLAARLYRRDCAVVVAQADRLPFEERRQRQIKKAGRANVRIVQETDFAAFWERVLTPRLAARHAVKPVHSVEEITLLASRFPENIRQFSVYCDDEIVAGTTIYETPTVAHAQYIAATDRGQKIGALDYLFAWLLDEFYRGKRYFDFGICNEQDGRVLNHGLQDWKEGFGGRGCAHDFYEIDTANYSKLESVLPSTALKS